MGKGDKKSAKGKRARGSYGVRRPRKKEAPAVKPEPAIKEPKPKKVTEPKAEKPKAEKPAKAAADKPKKTSAAKKTKEPKDAAE